MDMTDPGLGFPKHTPSVIAKKREKLDAAKLERDCRAKVKARDQGHCRIPDCRRKDVEMHHVIPRSRSKAKKWHTGNNCLLCTDHHRLRHAGKIQISGDADGELIITGDVNALRFKL